MQDSRIQAYGNISKDDHTNEQGDILQGSRMGEQKDTLRENQNALKEWVHIYIYICASKKQQAVYEYTKESLQTILEAGGGAGIIQIGNGIN